MPLRALWAMQGRGQEAKCQQDRGPHGTKKTRELLQTQVERVISVS